jgi:DNA-binding NarL/FixJ family response regulator
MTSTRCKRRAMEHCCSVWGTSRTVSYFRKSRIAAPLPCMQARIYLVEDNPLILEWLGQALEELTHARVVGSAATQAEACEWLNGHPGGWDAAVVDLWLAQGNGIHVIVCLHTSPAQKIVVLTNYPTQHMREVCLSAGADAFFDKSTELDEFIDYMARELGHAQSAPGTPAARTQAPH